MSVEDALVFRDATEADVAAIVGLLADDKLGAARERVSDPVDPAYLTAFRAIEADPHNRVIVAESDGSVVGCAQFTVLHGLSRRGLSRGLIESVRIAGSQRGRRAGERMIRHLLDLAREAGCGLVQLTTDVSRVDAKRFYERLGFEASHVGMKIVL